VSRTRGRNGRKEGKIATTMSNNNEQQQYVRFHRSFSFSSWRPSTIAWAVSFKYVFGILVNQRPIILPHLVLPIKTVHECFICPLRPLCPFTPPLRPRPSGICSGPCLGTRPLIRTTPQRFTDTARCTLKSQSVQSDTYSNSIA
jgi:hypothetical protein